MSGNGVLKFRNGDSYEGKCLKKIPYLSTFYEHEDSFLGGFLSGFFYGQGKFTYNDGGFSEVY